MSGWDKLQNKIDVKINKLVVPVGKVSGTLFTILGSLGIMAFGIPIIVMLILASAMASSTVFLSIAAGLSPLLGLSILSMVKGNNTRKRLIRFQRYIRMLDNRYYCPVKELAAATGQSNLATAKDLRKMIHLGMFPQGHVDEQNVYFMINDKYYQEYTRLQHNAKIKALEASQDKKLPKATNLTKEEQQVIAEGREVIKEIKRANDQIPGAELSMKLARLEDIGEKIFEYVEAHPEKIPQIKRFTAYFLPTTLKLADTYARLDLQPVQGDNISAAKQEIETTMDTIYDAFKNLLDGLFEDVALDVSTDISVLETIIAQEGLGQSTFHKENKSNGGE